MYNRKCTTCGKDVTTENRFATIIRCEECKDKLGLSKRDYDSDEFVYCRICNATKRRLDFHIKAEHKMTADEYSNKYPDAPIFSTNNVKFRVKDEDTRLKMSLAAKKGWANKDIRQTRIDAIMRNPSMKGKVLSECHRQKIAQSVSDTKQSFRHLTLKRRIIRKRASKSQLKEFVVCPLCLAETNDETLSRVGLMTTSHLKHHNYTTKQFRQKYPEIRISRGDKRLQWQTNFNFQDYRQVIDEANNSKLLDTKSMIYCRYCLKSVKRIASRHLDKHKLTIDMYTILFPHVPLVTQDVIDISTTNMTKTMFNQHRLNVGYHNRGLYGFRQDINLFVRSMIEANFCRILKLNNVQYEYESESFKLNHENFNSYTPDIKLLTNFEFWLSGSYIELKHTIGEESLEKVNIFRSIYHDKTIHILAKRSSEWRVLERKYRHLIPLWETSMQNVNTMPSLYQKCQ
jgi:DNA-directed RNA polymerase subunit RPC12/RpoP